MKLILREDRADMWVEETSCLETKQQKDWQTFGEDSFKQKFTI